SPSLSRWAPTPWTSARPSTRTPRWARASAWRPRSPTAAARTCRRSANNAIDSIAGRACPARAARLFHQLIHLRPGRLHDGRPAVHFGGNEPAEVLRAVLLRHGAELGVGLFHLGLVKSRVHGLVQLLHDVLGRALGRNQ